MKDSRIMTAVRNLTDAFYQEMYRMNADRAEELTVLTSLCAGILASMSVDLGRKPSETGGFFCEKLIRLMEKHDDYQVPKEDKKIINGIAEDIYNGDNIENITCKYSSCFSRGTWKRMIGTLKNFIRMRDHNDK